RGFRGDGVEATAKTFCLLALGRRIENHARAHAESFLKPLWLSEWKAQSIISIRDGNFAPRFHDVPALGNGLGGLHEALVEMQFEMRKRVERIDDNGALKIQRSIARRAGGQPRIGGIDGADKISRSRQ